jgi:hypothetical protein
MYHHDLTIYLVRLYYYNEGVLRKKNITKGSQAMVLAAKQKLKNTEVYICVIGRGKFKC